MINTQITRRKIGKKIGSIAAAIAFSFAASLAFSNPASAQLNIKTVDTDPLTGLHADDWAKLAVRLVNGGSVLGRPEIFLVNATGQDLSAVTCDGKWQLVGTHVYKSVQGNVSVLPAWKVTIIHTDDFDGYCKTGVIGQSDTGQLYKGALVSSDGTFTNASFITFQKPIQ